MDGQQRVHRRRVFYVPGYDPFPPRRYREFYRKEGAAQAAISGYSLSLQAEAPGRGAYVWRVETQIGGRETEARVQVLVWSDLVQASMRRNIPGAYALMVRTLWIFLSTGALAAMLRLRPKSILTGAWPVAMLTAQLLLALAAAALLWRLVAALVGGWAGQALGLALAAAALAAVLVLFRRLDAKLFAYYLLYDFAQVAAHRGGYGAALQARLDGFVDEVAAALTEGHDEVLVVGHSSGAALAVSLAAAVERRGLPEGGAPPLALLTLGQAIPMQAFLPEAKGLRADLQQLAASRAVTWVDVTAQGDGVCFWLTDPPAVCGVVPADRTGPLVFSAAFSQTVSREKWKKIRRQFFRLHIQYLAAFERPRDYDYFQITAGPVLLADRYRNRAPSPQVERRVFSPHRSVK
ncbi:MAG: lipase family protein [Pararhodobacter sp.]